MSTASAINSSYLYLCILSDFNIRQKAILVGECLLGGIVQVIQMMHSHINLQYIVFMEIVKEGLTFNVSSSYTRSNVAVE